ncbi:MAG: type II toxin-antitoxin system RelE/ParE family toxin [Rhodopila sp.]
MADLRLSTAAEADIVRLLAYIQEQFGDVARRRYEALLATGLADIAALPDRPGSVPRPELGPWVCSYHLRYSRERARTAYGVVHRPRHLLLYRVIRSDLIGVGRVLHDGIELERHLLAQYDDE